MSDSGRYDELVGETIMTCQDVNLALKDTTHPCNKIVNWQSTELPELRGLKTFDLSVAHRPEPWAGNLAEAKILFLGSNPSVSTAIKKEAVQWLYEYNSDDIQVTFTVREYVRSIAKEWKN